MTKKAIVQKGKNVTKIFIIILYSPYLKQKLAPEYISTVGIERRSKYNRLV